MLVEAQTSGLPCFVADNITKQVNVTPLMKYISINEKPKYWADIMNKELLGSVGRNNYYTYVQKAGFDEKQVAKELERIYMEH